MLLCSLFLDPPVVGQVPNEPRSMSSQDQRSDMVDDSALIEGRPTAKEGEPPAVGHGAGSGSGMTVAGLWAFYCVTAPLSRSE